MARNKQDKVWPRKQKIVEYIKKDMKTSEIQLLTDAPESMIRTIKQKKDYQTANDHWDKILCYP